MKQTNSRMIAFLLTIFFIIPLFFNAITMVTDYWWFQSLGYEKIFMRVLYYKAIFWVAGFLIIFLFLFINLTITLKLAAMSYQRTSSSILLYAGKFFHTIAVTIIFLLAVMFASVFSDNYEVLLKYIYSTDFAISDPIFNKDISYYFFQLPLMTSIKNWILFILLISLIISIVVYALKGVVNIYYTWKIELPDKIKIHIALLLAAIAFTLSIQFILSRYDMLYTKSGVVYGAGFTDIHARLYSYWIMGGVTLLSAIGFIVILFNKKLFSRGTMIIVGIIAVFFAVNILFQVIFPTFLQKFIVEPNELEKEKDYIANNIKFTRLAYGLDAVERRSFPVNNNLTTLDLAENATTIRNIRLWDWKPLLSTYKQLQEMRLYYNFIDVDIDRYNINNDYRQVMIAARELSYSQVPEQAKTWVNQRLKYTHGYGLVMSPVDRVTQEGLPEFFIKDIPPNNLTDIKLNRPEIYYGEETDEYIFTGTDTDEFDYPKGDSNQMNRYQGQGGVSVGSFWRRLVYAIKFGSIKILISEYFNENSKVHYFRNIKERVNKIAPFLQLDKDPYIAIVGGRLLWIIDAYTLEKKYPYSEPFNNHGYNYIRNSVKVVIDAYDGSVKFYSTEMVDPVFATYKKIFPKLFIDAKDTPIELKEHFRYPQDLFTIQSKIYQSYHMSDPAVFYNREDMWRFPKEKYEDSEVVIDPYYVIMRLPGEKKEEFLLIMPFTPVNKNNMISWMAARSDGNNFNKLSLYEFPKKELVYGPMQIEARIDQHPDISQQLTLWSQQGSRVIRGNLLVIPVNGSILYVEPLYIRSEQGQMPELKRVILAYGNEIVMEETLDRALRSIFTSFRQNKKESNSVNLQELISIAVEKYNRAEEAIKKGNWKEYGQYQEELKQVLKELQNQSSKLKNP